MDRTTPVVVLNLFNHTGVGIARSLGRLGVPVYGVHADDDAASARSRYVVRTFIWDLEGETEDASVEYLLDVARQLGKIPILIPTEDLSCLFVADNAPRLRSGFLFPNQPERLARALSSKKEMSVLCKQFGIPTPDVEFPRSHDEVTAFAEHASFPVVLKSIEARPFDENDPSRPGAGKMIVTDAGELIEGFEKMARPQDPNVLVQEYIPGGAESIWMFNGYFDRASDSLVAFTGQKIRQYPPYTGQTSLGICTWNERVAGMTRSFMKDLGYQGILDLGYRYDRRDDQYKLLDVNPRIGAAFRLFLGDNGMDVARALYLDLTGQRVPRTIPREGRKWVVENYDLAASAKYRRDRSLTITKWLRSFRNVEEAAWLARDDLAPFRAMLGRSFRYTVDHFLTPRRATPDWWRTGRPAP